MRLILRSIHGRMLALSAIATIVALVIAGAAIMGVLARFVTQGLDQRLDAELSLLATAVKPDGTIDRGRIVQVKDALDTDHGWRWRIDAPADSASSRDFPTLDVPPAPPHRTARDAGGRPHPAEARGRDGQRMHARTLSIASTSGPVVLTAAAPWAVVSRPIGGALIPLLVTLAILGVALGGAAIIQLRLGLRPLRRLRDSVAAIRNGQARSLPADQPDELRPLAIELEALLRDNEAALATARASAANLAHALKTPVATLALELRDDPVRAAHVDRLYATIRHHLARARNGVADRRAATPLDEVVDDLVETVARLHADRTIGFVRAIAAGTMVAIDRADLEELVGNLIDNAARHATTRVAIEAMPDGAVVRLVVTDDGHGIPAADRLRATAPGVRLDERGDGDGFGLTIARDLAELNGGRLTLADAPGGGLAATVELRRVSAD